MGFYQVQSRRSKEGLFRLILAVALPLLQDVRVDPRRGGRLRQADAGLPRRPACPAQVPEAAASIGEAGPGLFKKGLMKFDLSEKCFPPPSDVQLGDLCWGLLRGTA